MCVNTMDGKTMTTIAFDGRILACDGMISSHKIDTLCFKKIKYVKDDCFVGAAGDLNQVNAFFHWCKQGGYVDYLSDTLLNINDSFEAIIITPSFVATTTDCIHLCPSSLPIAIGSGSDFAIGAMKKGADAIEAVEIAKSYDLWSGGQTFYYEIDK